MRTLVAFPCLVAALAGAAELKTTDARISQVTVYADRAEVVRHFEVTLPPGDHSLIFDNLPAQVDASTIRVDGTGAFTLVDIRTETVQLKDVANEPVRKLEAALKVQALRDKEITFSEARIAFQKSAVEKVLTRLTSSGKDSANPEMDPLKWAAFLDFHAKQLADLDQAGLEQQKFREAMRKETDRLNRELNHLRGHAQRYHEVAKVNIEVRTAGLIALNLTYVVHGPSWWPLYDMRADTKLHQLTVGYNAQIRQATGEDWKQVSLKLSTAQPGINGREPSMNPWFVSRLMALPRGGASFGGGDKLASDAAKSSVGQLQMFNGFATSNLESDALKRKDVLDEKVEMEKPQATVSNGSTAATFNVDRVNDILSDNKPSKVTITELTFPATYRHTCVPKLSDFVYLKTKAVNKSAFVFLPGMTSVFLDGAFVAKARLDLVPAGQEFWTYLGVDPAVTVERKQLARREETSGVFGKKTNRTVIDQVFKLKNSKSADIDLVIWDQVPITRHEDIKVVIEEPRIEKDSDSVKINEWQQIEWHQPLKTGEKKELPFRFVIERPEDVTVVGL